MIDGSLYYYQLHHDNGKLISTYIPTGGPDRIVYELDHGPRTTG